jgi:hypothetical protein
MMSSLFSFFTPYLPSLSERTITYDWEKAGNALMKEISIMMILSKGMLK